MRLLIIIKSYHINICDAFCTTTTEIEIGVVFGDLIYVIRLVDYFLCGSCNSKYNKVRTRMVIRFCLELIATFIEYLYLRMSNLARQGCTLFQ